MNLAGETNIGTVRTNNQDCFAHRKLSSRLCYAVVCDGMGGENGGQVASALALAAIKKSLDTEITPLTRPQSIKYILECAVASANSSVFERASKDSALKGMGTTAVVAVVLDDVAYIANVGDSRAYLFDPDRGEIIRLTRDHTVVQMLLDRGEITTAQAATHPQRNYITRAVGVARTVDSDCIDRELGGRGCLLLCSDGLYNYIPEGEMALLLPQCAQENTVAPLIERANANGGGDNITAVLVSRLDNGGNVNG